MSGKVIGKSLNHGFAGQFARTPDMIIVTRSAEGEIKFGDVVIAGTTGMQVKKADNTTTATNVIGIAGAEVKSAYNYFEQSEGAYADKEAVAVLERGSISAECKNGTPTINGKVYIAKTASAFSGAEVGDLAAEVSGTANTDYVELTNCKWGGEKDANGVAELVFLSRVNV